MSLMYFRYSKKFPFILKNIGAVRKEFDGNSLKIVSSIYSPYSEETLSLNRPFLGLIPKLLVLKIMVNCLSNVWVHVYVCLPKG